MSIENELEEEYELRKGVKSYPPIPSIPHKWTWLEAIFLSLSTGLIGFIIGKFWI
jgi:hypothetical protein